MKPSDVRQMYIGLKDSPIGKHLIAWMEDEYQRTIEAATQSNDPHEAYGLLKNANGILKVIRHIQSRAIKQANPKG